MTTTTLEPTLQTEITREQSRAADRIRSNWLKAVGGNLPGRFKLFALLPVEIPDWTKPNKGKPRLFQSDVLEALTVVHPIVPLAIYVPISACLLYRGLSAGLSVAAAAGLWVGGLFFWTFFEYVMHRGVFHFTPKTRWEIVLAYFMHGIHHAFPEDDRRLVMPPVVSLTLSIPVYVAFRLLMGAYYGPALSGFFIGYLGYDMTHYAVHALPMRSAFGNWIRKHHMLHHYATPDRRYGVSTPLWDFVFGTYR